MCTISPIQYNGNRFPFSIFVKNTFFFRTWSLILSETCQVWRGPCCPETSSYLHRLSCPQFQFHPFPPSGPWICLSAGLWRCSLDPDLSWHLLLQLCGDFPFLGSLSHLPSSGPNLGSVATFQIPCWSPAIDWPVFLFPFFFFFIIWRLITLQYCSGFCHTLKWISLGFTCVPHPDPPSHLPLLPIPPGLPSIYNCQDMEAT